MMVDGKAGKSGRHQLNRDVSSAMLCQLNYDLTNLPDNGVYSMWRSSVAGVAFCQRGNRMEGLVCWFNYGGKAAYIHGVRVSWQGG
jgi:hypothetical protein